MSAGKICTRITYTATPEESVRHAAIRMEQQGIGTVVVVDEYDRAVGMVTDRDIVLRCVAERLDPDQMRVGDVMSAPVCAVTEETAIETALSTMAGAQVRRAVVVDSDGMLVGVLALDDVLELLVEEAASIGALLRAQAPA